MKEVLEVSAMIVELILDDESAESLGKWPWPEAMPRAGDIIEHEDDEYEVVVVRWSTIDPHQVEVRVRRR